MTLVLQDSQNVIISEESPTFTEHNGTKGETVEIDVFVVNQSTVFEHRAVTLQVVGKAPVSMQVKKAASDTLAASVELGTIKPLETRRVIASVTIPEGVEAQVIDGSWFRVDSLKYPSRVK